MRTYQVTHHTDDGRIRIRTQESGRVLAAVTSDEARLLWIKLGAELGLGTDKLTIRNVERASSLKQLAKHCKKHSARAKK